ncbi:hypothetical protein ACO0RG_004261 [Hanseniaspora osmophila]|uniref:2-dehydropantoate 2-reductase n=1 Tax=Hanseniaspora osmophila TaxID=56408 RepID=A0A1E5RBN3_9ASCO|nr:Uncharacterized protein AWRI3579_g2885 [Hanseniaspora osmophila]
MTLKVLVIGAGGVGVLTAYSLFHRAKCEVSLVVRSDYEKAVQDGYEIDSCDYGQIHNWKPHHLYRSIEEASASGQFFDYLVVTTKNIPDGPSPVRKFIEPVLKSCFENWDPKTGKSLNVFLVQNGIDIELEIIDLLKADHLCSDGVHGPKVTLLSGVQMIGSTKIGNCQILHKGQDYLIMGAFDPKDTLAISKVAEFKDLYWNEGKNHFELDENVKWSRWRKLVYNATINPLTAIVGLDFTRTLLFGFDGSTEFGILRPAMKEILAIAKSDGHIIPEEVMDYMIDCDRTMVYKPSMMVDVEKTQLMELEVILGNPLKVAAQNKVPCPNLTLLYNIGKIIQGRTKEKIGMITFNEKTGNLE